MAPWMRFIGFASLLVSAEYFLRERRAVYILSWFSSVLSLSIGLFDLAKKKSAGFKEICWPTRQCGWLLFVEMISLYLAIYNASLIGFAACQIAGCVLVKLLEPRSLSRSRAIFAMLFSVIGLLFLLLQESLIGLLICCAYSYFAHLVKSLETDQCEESSLITAKLCSGIFSTIFLMPFACFEMLRMSDQPYARIEFIVPIIYIASLYNFAHLDKRWLDNRFHFLFNLLVASIISTLPNPFSVVDILSYISVSIALYLSESVKPQERTLTDGNNFGSTRCRSILSTAVAVFVVGILIIYTLTVWRPPIDSHYNTPYSATLIPVESSKEISRLQCINSARQLIIERVTNLAQGQDSVCLMDLPLHWNLGDSFIWHGDNIFISLLGLPATKLSDYPQRRLSDTKISNGTSLFLHGGGNFGDWWRENADFRLSVLKDRPNNRIVFLPQSISYRDHKYIAIDREAFEKHTDLTLLLRDLPSLNFAKLHFPNTEAIFVPDMAFMMGPLVSVNEPTVDILFLLRTDTEKQINVTELTISKQRTKTLDISYEIWDFPVDGYPVHEHPSEYSMYDYRMIYPGLTGNDIPTELLPILRVAMGNRLLSRGSVIVTDRLHASILGGLIGRPVVYVDNAYKKLSNIWSSMANEIPTCSSENMRVQHADSILRAVDLAYEWIRQNRK